MTPTPTFHNVRNREGSAAKIKLGTHGNMHKNIFVFEVIMLLLEKESLL